MKERYGDAFSVIDKQVVLRIDVPETKSYPKGCTAEEKAVIHEENAIAKEKLAKMAEEIPNKWACIKRDFVGGPIY